MAFKGFILARRDEGKHAVVRCVRRTIRDPDDREFDGLFSVSIVYIQRYQSTTTCRLRSQGWVRQWQRSPS